MADAGETLDVKVARLEVRVEKIDSAVERITDSVDGLKKDVSSLLVKAGFITGLILLVGDRLIDLIKF